jgi:hypothetical protein
LKVGPGAPTSIPGGFDPIFEKIELAVMVMPPAGTIIPFAFPVMMLLGPMTALKFVVVLTEIPATVFAVKELRVIVVVRASVAIRIPIPQPVKVLSAMVVAAIWNMLMAVEFTTAKVLLLILEAVICGPRVMRIAGSTVNTVPGPKVLLVMVAPVTSPRTIGTAVLEKAFWVMVGLLLVLVRIRIPAPVRGRSTRPGSTPKLLLCAVKTFTVVVARKDIPSKRLAKNEVTTAKPVWVPASAVIPVPGPVSTTPEKSTPFVPRSNWKQGDVFPGSTTPHWSPLKPAVVTTVPVNLTATAFPVPTALSL